MYICVYVCVYIYIYICESMFISELMYVCIHTHNAGSDYVKIISGDASCQGTSMYGDTLPGGMARSVSIQDASAVFLDGVSWPLVCIDAVLYVCVCVREREHVCVCVEREIYI